MTEDRFSKSYRFSKRKDCSELEYKATKLERPQTVVDLGAVINRSH